MKPYSFKTRFNLRSNIPMTYTRLMLGHAYKIIKRMTENVQQNNAHNDSSDEMFVSIAGQIVR